MFAVAVVVTVYAGAVLGCLYAAARRQAKFERFLLMGVVLAPVMVPALLVTGIIDSIDNNSCALGGVLAAMEAVAAYWLVFHAASTGLALGDLLAVLATLLSAVVSCPWMV